MNNKHVFVLVTSLQCPTCINFKNNIWDSLKKKLNQIENLELVYIEIPSNTFNTSNIPDKYNKDIIKYIGWFPSILLFTGKSWYNLKEKLVGTVMNGIFIGDELRQDRKIRFHDEEIYKWVKNTLSTNLMFKNINEIIITNGDDIIATTKKNTKSVITNNNNNNSSLSSVKIHFKQIRLK